jgi:hypothetical protein
MVMTFVRARRAVGPSDLVPRIASPTDLGADLLVGGVGVGAEGSDGADTYPDDQSQHHGVFDGSRAVFVQEERENALTEQGQHGEHPFGNLAIPEGPKALRPTLADGLPLSRNTVATVPYKSWGVLEHQSNGNPAADLFAGTGLT